MRKKHALVNSVLAIKRKAIQQAMTLDDLTVNINHLDQDTMLEDWRWLIGKKKRPILVTVAGDVFVQDLQEKTVHFLDTVEGTFTQVSENDGEFEKQVADKNFVMKYFSVNLVAPLLKAGHRPKKGHIFEFKKPPVLGGEFETENLETADIEVHFSMLGQIWAQVSKLAPGTPIGKIEIK